MSQQIKEALAKLDVNNHLHWTSDNLPVIEIVKELMGAPVTRAEITAAAKGFSRKTPVLDSPTVPEVKDETITFKVEPKDEKAENTAAGINAAPAKDEVESEEDGEQASPSDEIIQEELDASRKALAEAQLRFNKALLAKDVVIKRLASEKASFTPADAIKAYQRSQAEQRALDARSKKFVLTAMENAKAQL